MERNWDMNEVSDGKKYGPQDMVKAGCNDCKGCSDCCYDKDDLIILDPLDVYRIQNGYGYLFQELTGELQAVQYSLVDGLILPSLKMQGTDRHCFFLNTEGRCAIHTARPGICRLYPLGRIYENGGFSYFLQVHECPVNPKTKVKVKQWIGEDNLKQHEPFIADWHYLLKEYQTKALAGEMNAEELKKVSMRLITIFYLTPYDVDEDFYEQYEVRRREFFQ